MPQVNEISWLFMLSNYIMFLGFSCFLLNFWLFNKIAVNKSFLESYYYALFF